MKNTRTPKIIINVVLAAVLVITAVSFHRVLLYFTSQAVLMSAKTYLPGQGITVPEFTSLVRDEERTSAVSEEATAQKAKDNNVSVSASPQEGFTDTPGDILKIIAERNKTAAKDKKDGSIKEKQYKQDGVTDSFGRVRVKNVNKTGIDIEKILGEKIDLSVKKDEPSVLIFHTHTTETYQILDRGFYETDFRTRSQSEAVNMVRVGKAICAEIEKAGYGVIHDTVIHDHSYNGAYAHSREAVEKILEENPSIQVVLDIHRDAIQLSDGTKIKPTAKIKGKKAAQIMIISGCQEEGNPITNLPDWKYNLTFAVHLQNKLEELYEGITRPLYFCPRSYNMNVTHCSLLVEVGSDANTLEEAVYTGKCIGVALSEILKEYDEKNE